MGKTHQEQEQILQDSEVLEEYNKVIKPILFELDKIQDIIAQEKLCSKNDILITIYPKQNIIKTKLSDYKIDDYRHTEMRNSMANKKAKEVKKTAKPVAKPTIKKAVKKPAKKK